MELHGNAPETPAAKAMRLMGAKRIAAKCDLTTNAVWKWETLSGGLIPSKHQADVLELAREVGVAFTAEDCIARAAA